MCLSSQSQTTVQKVTLGGGCNFFLLCLQRISFYNIAFLNTLQIYTRNSYLIFILEMRTTVSQKKSKICSFLLLLTKKNFDRKTKLKRIPADEYWKDGSMLKGTHCSSGVSEFSTMDGQETQIAKAPVPGNSTTPLGTFTHMHTDKHAYKYLLKTLKI